MFCIGIKMENAYLKGKMQYGFVGYQTDNTTNESKTDYTSDENLQDFSDSSILKNMEQVYGVIPANAIIKYVSQHIGKSRLDILSNFETFSRIIKQVYGEVEGKKFLSKLPEQKSIQSTTRSRPKKYSKNFEKSLEYKSKLRSVHTFQ